MESLQGIWMIVLFRTDPPTGKRKQQWISVKGTKKDADKRLAELLHQLDTGMFMKPSHPRLKMSLLQNSVSYPLAKMKMPPQVDKKSGAF
jgi:hypothetical protein